MIACTFFLDLVKDGNDSNTIFSLLYIKQWGGESSKENSDIVKNCRQAVFMRNYFCFLQGLLNQEKVQQ